MNSRGTNAKQIQGGEWTAQNAHTHTHTRQKKASRVRPHEGNIIKTHTWHDQKNTRRTLPFSGRGRGRNVDRIDWATARRMATGTPGMRQCEGDSVAHSLKSA